MKRGLSAESFNASRSLFTAVFKAVIVIDESVGRPEPLPQLFPGHHVARAIEKVE
jgi:hypothetical protein